MAMDLYEYFSLRCASTAEGVQNMRALFGEMLKSTKHAQLRDIVQEQHDALQAAESNLKQITGMINKTVKKRRTEETTETHVIIVGRRWIGEAGRDAVEEHRTLITEIPQNLIDINAAMLSEEVTHFNLGNYTGLIVLAKQLGEMEIANLLQQNIDHEEHMRMRIEGSIWDIIGSLRGEQRMAA